MLVDSHAHLDDARFGEDRDAVLERAWDAGIRTILTIGNGEGSDDMACGVPFAEGCDWIYTTVGVHPHDAERVEPRHLAMMEELAARDRVLAIGETGLDFYYDNSPRDTQCAVFRSQVELAVRLDLPVIIHTRDADPETIRILEDLQPRKGIVHCFTGGEALARSALDLGLMISFSGILTFKTADPIRSIAAWVPTDRTLVETDAPYLAPVPHRGKRNEPAFVSETARTLAEIRNTDEATIHEQTTRNFHDLFGI